MGDLIDAKFVSIVRGKGKTAITWRLYEGAMKDIDEEDISTGKVSRINRYVREKIVPADDEGSLTRVSKFDGILTDEQCRAYLIKELSTVLAKTVIPEQKLGDIKVESKAKAPKALSVRAI